MKAQIQKKPIIECCEGCARILLGFCTVYDDPLAVWDIGKNVCPMSTFGKKVVQEQKKINPLKASKKKARGGK